MSAPFLYRERAGKAVAGLERMERPARYLFRIVGHGQERCLAQGERDLEVTEREREAVAPRLDVGFLPGPALEEGAGPARRRAGPQCRHFAGREEASAIFRLASAGRMRSMSTPASLLAAMAYSATSSEWATLKRSPVASCGRARAGLP
jgi:hypothetical protein